MKGRHLIASCQRPFGLPLIGWEGILFCFLCFLILILNSFPRRLQRLDCWVRVSRDFINEPIQAASPFLKSQSPSQKEIEKTEDFGGGCFNGVLQEILSDVGNFISNVEGQNIEVNLS